MHENLKVENCFTGMDLKGLVHWHEGSDTSSFPNDAPDVIIQTSQPCFWAIQFNQKGPLCRFLDPQSKWRVRMYLEQMGGEEYSLPKEYSQAEFNYQCKEGWQPDPFFHVKIPGNTVPPGTYRAVATLTFRDKNGVPGPVAAFADCGIIQFYKEGV